MGQRHQIYVVRKTKDSKTNETSYSAIGAFHHQWCYGLTAASNCARLADTALKIKQDGDEKNFESFYLREGREIDVLVKAIYDLSLDHRLSMVHNEQEYLITDGVAYPERGDNNDGATLLVIDEVKKEIRACLFTPAFIEGTIS